MLTKSMTIQNNEIMLHNRPLKWYAKTYQTPLMIYDEDAIIEQINNIQQAFHSTQFKTSIVYASKAFLCQYMSKLVVAHNMLIDVVSMGEAHTVLSSGVNPNQIIFHGNNKSKEELDMIVKHQFRYVVVDNVKELNTLIELASKSNVTIRTLFRINPGIEAHTHEYIQTSLLNSKFGESIFDQVKIEEIMNIYKHNNHVILDGFHIHIGSQIKQIEPYEIAVETMMNFCNTIKHQYHLDITTLNFGGGFGIKYLETDETYDIVKLLQQMIHKIETINQTLNVGIKHVLIEPGRVIVGPNGFTLYEASQIKHTYGGKHYCFIDGGMADNIRPALYQAKYTIKVVDQYESNNQICVDVVGKCCESGDIIAKDIWLPQHINDSIIIVFATGAYGYSMSSNYNGLPRPEVLFVTKEKIEVAIKREKLDDLVK
jgi:diaminopimelate decarboxylase